MTELQEFGQLLGVGDVKPYVYNCPPDMPGGNVSEKTLREIQYEVGEWSTKNFGIHDYVNPLMGIGEEYGELLHVTLKHRQGIRGYDDRDKYEAERNDAVSDLLIYLCDYCCEEKIDLLGELQATWAKVSRRNWVENPENAHEAV